jgi:N-acetylglucosamine-6-sulfatase
MVSRNHAGLTNNLKQLSLFLLAALVFVSNLLGQNQRPNFLIIMTDDQSHDTLTQQFMPNTKAMIADQGLTCTQFIMPTALCCPSRSSLLTGQYARHHGAWSNSTQLVGPTVANRLHEAGYYTGLIGKYLNSWPGDARPEYDYWAAWINGYLDPRMNIFGVFRNVPGYLTYIQRDYAYDFLSKVPANQPFFLLFTPHAPHQPATPAPGDEHLFAGLPNWRPPNFNPFNQPDKPLWLANTPQLNARTVQKRVDKIRLNQLRCLHSVDLAVRDILLRLAQEGKLDNTFIVYYSDNGFFWGEHRLVGKNRVYEEASRGPFAVRYPPLIKAARTEDRLVGVIDLAPTIYELAGLPIPPEVDGRSLLPLLRGTEEWRDAMLLEGWPGSYNLEIRKTRGKASGEDEDLSNAADARNAHRPDLEVPEDYEAIRTMDYIYIETKGDKPELYNLKIDPFQMHNLIGHPGYADLIMELSYRLHHDKL